MVVRDGPSGRARSGWRTHLRGHLFLFEPKPAITSRTLSGGRLLLAAALVEAVRLAAVLWLRPYAPVWLLLPALLGLALWIVPAVAGVKLSELGFRPWRDWSRGEKSYFVQVLCVANLIFLVVLAGARAKEIAEPSLARGFATVFVPYLFFGFYQEIVYRGLVQVGLVRRWGAPIGVGVANVLYTLGPLHFYYFASPASFYLPMFAAVFAIGLFFGLLYWRSGNLWMVAVFHAIGNAYLVWAFR